MKTNVDKNVKCTTPIIHLSDCSAPLFRTPVLSTRVLTHRYPATVLFVTVRHAAAVVKSVTAVGHCNTALVGTGKLVGLTL